MASSPEWSQSETRNRILSGLAVAPAFRALVESGFAIRDNEDWPGRRYLLGHIAREARSSLSEHVCLYFDKPVPTKTPRIPLAEYATEWVANISPLINATSAVPQAIQEISLPIALLSTFDMMMRGQAEVYANNRSRAMKGFRELAKFVSPDLIENAVDRLMKLEAEKVGHVPLPTKAEMSVEEIHTFWDSFELSLFELFGSPALAAQSDDQMVSRLNNL